MTPFLLLLERCFRGRRLQAPAVVEDFSRTAATPSNWKTPGQPYTWKKSQYFVKHSDPCAGESHTRGLLAAGRSLNRLIYFNFEDERLAGLAATDLHIIPDIHFRMFPEPAAEPITLFLGESGS